ncbi:Uncharacterized protein DAT39_006717 [Clarias magur]|uniref:Uncharacterized protein n=1 Tax=Clarias magur TaxID=1594786 RepID=A0A8J4UCF9_CLAMG|nr:Uncharacterized protein DAT39_006717 [Clarias magur]
MAVGPASTLFRKGSGKAAKKPCPITSAGGPFGPHDLALVVFLDDPPLASCSGGISTSPTCILKPFKFCGFCFSSSALWRRRSQALFTGMSIICQNMLRNHGLGTWLECNTKLSSGLPN